MMGRLLRGAIVVLSTFAVSAHAGIDVLLDFTGTGGDTPGANPLGSMILDGSTLYGFTSVGGTNNYGVIFSVGTDGSGYTVVHHFSGPDNTNGNQPHHGYLLLDGTTLLRSLYGGGADGDGTIFSVGIDGSNPTPQHTFTGSSSSPTSLGDGSQAHSGLLAGPGNVYYGLTAEGGTANHGTLFSFDATTGDVTTLYAFHTSSGSEAHGQVIWDSTGTRLIGMTREGGTGMGNSNTGGDAPGVIFSFDPAVPDSYTVLANFTAEGTSPYLTEHGNLTLGTGAKATTLFGMTEYGGANDAGAIFSLAEDGSTPLTILHSFGAGTTDGNHPYGSLTLGPDGYLYGMAREGGANNDGAIFRLAQDGTDYSILASFDAAITGNNPIDNVTISPDGTTLYGLTQFGAANNVGAIFALNIPPVPEPGSLALLAMAGTALGARRMFRKLSDK